MQLSKKDLINYFYNKSVIILGSAPSVKENKAEFLESFDVIVRLNNYKFFNECVRTDIYYSYFGRSIKKTKQDIINDDIKYIICKYPNCNWGDPKDGIQDNWSWVYEYRKGFFPIPYYIPSNKVFKENFDILNRVPTTGIAAILDIFRFKPKSIYISGFDFFSSKIHNIGEPWKDGDGNHDLEKEKWLIKIMYRLNLIDVDNKIKDLL
jgi:hypothetical protein